MKRRTIIPEVIEIVHKDDSQSEQSHLTYDQCVEQFLTNRTSRNLSKDTLKYYQQKLSLYRKRHFTIYGKKPNRRITERNINDFVNYHTITLGNKISSAQASLRAMKAYSTFLVEQEIEEKNPFDNYVIKKPKVQSIKTFSEVQIQRLLAQPDTKTFVGLRDYVLLTTFLDTGIRMRELTSLNVEDVNFEDNYISVLGKNGHVRNVPMSMQLKSLVTKYVQARGQSYTEALFISSVETRFTRRAIQDRLIKYGKKANITDVRVSPHTFRHTFAKMYLKSGGNIFVLQDILGHQTLEMVRVYVRLFSKDLYDDHKRHNPLGKI